MLTIGHVETVKFTEEDLCVGDIVFVESGRE